MTSSSTSKNTGKSTVLHQWEISPFCGKVRRILQAKEIAFQSKNYNGMLVPFAANLSGVGKLPVLDINNERIADSRVIARYLESEFPDRTSLIPVDEQEKVQMTVYEDWADSSLYWYNFYFLTYLLMMHFHQDILHKQ